MTNDKEAYNRRSIRLQNYDYSQPGLYFVTICTHEKKWMFGEIVNGEMCLNDIGQLTQSIWNSLPGRFPHVELDEFIIMPNHLHGIIICGGTYSGTQRASYSSNIPERFQLYMSTTPSTVHQRVTKAPPPHPVGRDKSGPYAVDASRPHREATNPVLGEIVRTFKAASTHRIRAFGRPDFGWQENYYEHIIRNDNDLDRIREYIVDNPAGWAEDSLYMKEGSLQ